MKLVIISLLFVQTICSAANGGEMLSVKIEENGLKYSFKIDAGSNIVEYINAEVLSESSTCPNAIRAQLMNESGKILPATNSGYSSAISSPLVIEPKWVKVKTSYVSEKFGTENIFMDLERCLPQTEIRAMKRFRVIFATRLRVNGEEADYRVMSEWATFSEELKTHILVPRMLREGKGKHP